MKTPALARSIHQRENKLFLSKAHRLYLPAFLLFLGFLSVTGCSSTSGKVYPAPGGSLRVFAEDSSRYRAQEKALETADQHCRSKGQQVKIIRETVNTDSSHGSETRRDAERASKTVEIITGDREEAKQVKDMTTTLPSGYNYRAEVIFECQ